MILATPDCEERLQKDEIKWRVVIPNHQFIIRYKNPEIERQEWMDIRRKASKIEISRKISGEKAYIFGGVKSERGNLRSIEGCMDRPEKSVQRQHGFSAYDELLPFLEPHSLTVVSHGPISPRYLRIR